MTIEINAYTNFNSNNPSGVFTIPAISFIFSIPQFSTDNPIILSIELIDPVFGHNMFAEVFQYQSTWGPLRKPNEVLLSNPVNGIYSAEFHPGFQFLKYDDRDSFDVSPYAGFQIIAQGINPSSFKGINNTFPFVHAYQTYAPILIDIGSEMPANHPFTFFPNVRLFEKINPDIMNDLQLLIWSSDDLGGTITPGWQIPVPVIPSIASVNEKSDYIETLDVEIHGKNFLVDTIVKADGNEISIIKGDDSIDQKITVKLSDDLVTVEKDIQITVSNEVGTSLPFIYSVIPPIVTLENFISGYPSDTELSFYNVIKAPGKEYARVILTGSGFNESNAFINPDVTNSGGITVLDIFTTEDLFVVVLEIDEDAPRGFRSFLYRQHGSPGIFSFFNENYLFIGAQQSSITNYDTINGSERSLYSIQPHPTLSTNVIIFRYHRSIGAQHFDIPISEARDFIIKKLSHAS